MKEVIGIILILLGFVIFLLVLFSRLIQERIWSNKGKVYRVRYDLEDDDYIAEKRFLCFWVKHYALQSFRSEEDAVKFISRHVNKQKKSYNPKIMDFNNMITDERKLLEDKNNKIENKYT